MKQCTKCGQTKPLDEFSRRNDSPDGRRSQCIECTRERWARYYATHREALLEYQARYRTTNPETVHERSARYRAANREKLSKDKARWYVANREAILEHAAEYRATHHEEISTYQARYRAAHPDRNARYYAANRDRERERRARYHAANPEKRREWENKRRAVKRGAPIGDKEAIRHIYDIAANGSRVRCYLCGRFVPKGQRHVDHVIPLSKGGLHAASNLDIACASCNFKKSAKLPEEIGMLTLVTA